MVRRLSSRLTLQVLVAVAIGIAIGALKPDLGVALKPAADAFIKLVKLVVAPVVFVTIVSGIAGMGDLKRVGRVGFKALVYFEVVTTLALGIGLLVCNLLRPGEGVDTSKATLDAVKQYTGKTQTTVEFLINIIPDGVLSPFVNGDSLQVLFLAVLSGIAVAMMGPRAEWVVQRVDRLAEIIFRVVGLVMRLAPLGALAAMAFTVGTYGTKSLYSLLGLMGCVYLTMGLFIVLVLGSVLRLCGVSLWRYLVYIKDEVLLVLGTSSSESALPRMILKLERSGCGPDIPKLVIPAGYSFNLDGTSIYLSMAVIFIAQAYGVPMSVGQQLTVLTVLMLTSKGAAGVTGSGFVTLAATLTATRALPLEGLALLLGVDRFMSEARAITNLIGNGVATIAVSKMEGAFDSAAFDAAGRARAGNPLPAAEPG